MDQTRVDDNIEASNALWSFGGNVPQNFEDHISRSVPLYKEAHDLIVQLSDFFIKDQSTCYDLGCATGELTQKLSGHHHQKNVHWVGIDCEEGMVSQAQKKTENKKNMEFFQGDILNFDFHPADLMISSYTMQFISPSKRQEAFNKVYESLNWGGAFILFEKVRGADARFQDILTTLYNDYKLDAGFTPEEIIAKTRSLKGVLEPFSSLGNHGLLSRAGFSDIQPVFKYLCFEGLLAIK
jgi:tRNA (cmo5U34)-methyltransferase